MHECVCACVCSNVRYVVCGCVNVRANVRSYVGAFVRSCVSAFGVLALVCTCVRV